MKWLQNWYRRVKTHAEHSGIVRIELSLFVFLQINVFHIRKCFFIMFLIRLDKGKEIAQFWHIHCVQHMFLPLCTNFQKVSSIFGWVNAFWKGWFQYALQCFVEKLLYYFTSFSHKKVSFQEIFKNFVKISFLMVYDTCTFHIGSITPV